MKLKKRNRNLIILIFLTIGMLSYSAIPFLSIDVLPTKVSAYGLSPVPEKEGMVYAVTASGKLINFNLVTPSSINRTVNITNLQAGELVVGVDFRPRTGQLLGVTNQSRVYAIDTLTGASTQVGTAPFTPGVTGGAYGVDFNPVVDLIRVVTNLDDQNLRINPNTGALAGADTAVAFAAADPNAGADPNIVGSAYTNSFSGATTTTLFGIDSDLDALVMQGGADGALPSPNGGQLTTIGQGLGVDTTEMVGFDISAPGNMALASLTSPTAPTSSSLYWIDLPTGTATIVSQIGGGEPIRDIAIVTRVETIFALSQSNSLITFNSGTPGTPISTLPITGIPMSESLVALDFRPATGELYSIGMSGRIYTINTATGLATAVSQAFVSAASNNPQLGFDFNPVPDLIRLTSANDQNLRISPNNGNVAANGVDGNLAYDSTDGNAGVDPNVVASAYSNNVAGAAPNVPNTNATTLYGIDSNLDVLVRQGTLMDVAPSVSPNTGRLFTIGGLTAGGMPLNVTDDVGFDIAGDTGAAFVSLTLQDAPTTSTLFTLNLASGAATPIGMIAGGEVIRDIAIGLRVEKVFAVTSGNTLATFNSRTPGIISRSVPINGLQSGETIVGIDFRPATGLLYGMTNRNNIYTIDTNFGLAFLVSATPFSPALKGTSFGFDFNPAADRIRVVSDQDGQNLRLNPDTGALAATDGNLVYMVGDIFAGQIPAGTAAAYANNIAATTPPTPTTLYLIDSSRNVLVRQGSAGGSPISPNGGQVSTIGPLGVIAGNQVGFDISDSSGTGYASFTPSGATQSQLFRINLRTGVATAVGANNSIATGSAITDIAVQTNFTPSKLDSGFVLVNSASFNLGPVAPGSLVSLFGAFQTQGSQTYLASTTPPPTTLGGVSVRFNAIPAAVSYATTGQINVVVPDSFSGGGMVLVELTNANGSTQTRLVQIADAAPGIFASNGSGRGTAFAYTTFDGRTYDTITNPDGSEKPVPIADANGRPNIVAVLSTGTRGADMLTVLVQGVSADIRFSGATSLIGIDQTNFVIPPALAQLIPADTGRLQVTLQFSANGQVSNVVTFTIAPPLGGTPPPPAAQRVALGQPINGSLAATDPAQVLPGDISRRPYLYDSYRFSASANSNVTIDLRSASFDTAVTLYQVTLDGNGNEMLTMIASDDNSSGQLGVDGNPANFDSLLTTLLSVSGDYIINVTSGNADPGATGSYSLNLFDSPFPVAGYGANIRESIGSGDRRTSAGSSFDVYQFQGTAGDRVQLRMSSELIDSFLELKLTDGSRFAFDNNSGGGAKGIDAMISVTLPYTGAYFVYATHSGSQFTTGSYTLSLTRTGRGLADEGISAGIETPAAKNSLWSIRAPFSAADYGNRRIIERLK
jgi:trimeric autotransporter adhesin